MTGRSLLIPAAVLLALGACATAAPQAAPPRLVSAGERLARENCGGCHALGANDASALPDAPPFRDLRARYSTQAMSQVLAERMETLHPRMPRLRLEEDQVSELLTYWDSLAPTPAARPPRPAPPI